MFACGLAWIAADVMRLGYMRGSIFLASLCTIVLLNVIFFNRFTKAMAALALGVGAVVFVYLGLTGGIAEELELFTAEVVDLLGKGIGDEKLRRLVGIGLGIVAGIAAFCTAGGLRGAVVMALATLAAFCAAWYSGERSIFGCMALCASATAAVSAAGFARRRTGEIERALEGEQEDDGGRDREVARRRRRSKRGDDVGGGEAVAAEKKRGARKAASRRAQASAVGAVGSPSGIALFAIPVVLLLAVACTLFRPTDFARNLRVRAVEGALDDAIDSIAQNIEGFTRRTTIFSLGAVGYGPAADLGGPVELTEGTTLVVDVNRPGYLHYLRGSVRSVYDGNGWRDGDLGGSYRFESRLWDEQREDAFDILRGGMSEANSYFLSAYKRVGYAVQHESHFTSMFTLDRPESVESRLYTPYFNLQGELFPKGTMEFGTSYSVTGYAQQNMTKNVAKNLSRLVERYAPDNDYERGGFEDKVYEEYLPDGEVKFAVLAGERSIIENREGALGQGVYYDDRYGWVQTPMAYLASSPNVLGAYVLPEYENMLDETKAWLRGRSDDYYLFYGYTEEDLALIEQNGEEINQHKGWLDGYRDPKYHEQLMAEFIEGLTWPEPQALWLIEPQLAVYGLEPDDALWSMKLNPDEGVTELRGDEGYLSEDFRRELRGEIFVTTLADAAIEHELQPDGGYVPTFDRTVNASVGNGYYTSERALRNGSRDTLAGLTRLAEAKGFARIEFAQKVVYYPELAGEYARTVALRYLASLEDFGEVNKFDMLLELAKQLDANADYTLDPMPVPEGVDFVDWFMSTNEGYCTYYATAMVIMARELGIPARYAEGYTLGAAQRIADGVYLTSTYALTGYDAHAWAEVWLDGVGWVTIDPLGLDALDAADIDVDDIPDVEIEVPIPSVEPTAPPLIEDDDREPTVIEEGLPLWAILLIAFGVLVFITVFAFAMVRVLVVRSRSLERLCRKYGDKGAAKHLWTEILTALEMIEPLCIRGDGETASEFAERVKGLVFVEGVPFLEVAQAAEVAWYAAREIRADELAKLDRCAAEMRRLMFRKAPLKVFWMVTKPSTDAR